MAISHSTNHRSNNHHSNNHNRGPVLLPTSGRELLLDLKRSTARNAGGSAGSSRQRREIPTLPPYNHKLVQACFRDLHATARELDLQARVHGGNATASGNGSTKPSMSARPSILLHNKTIQRQKQCLLAYHHHRVEIIKEIERAKMASNEGKNNHNHNHNHNNNHDNNNHNGNGNAPISTNAREVALAFEYASLRAAYSERVFELDLLPPTSHMVQVRVTQTVGQVVLPDSGRVVALTRGARLFLDRADAGDFLKQGIVCLCDGEEVNY